MTLTITNVATDSDVPPNALTFSLDAGRPTASIGATDGVFAWTPPTPTLARSRASRFGWATMAAVFVRREDIPGHRRVPPAHRWDWSDERSRTSDLDFAGGYKLTGCNPRQLGRLKLV